LEGDPENIVVVDEGGIDIPYEVVGDGKKKIRVIFENKNSGIGRKRHFTIAYKLKKIGEKKGELKEIYIPGTSIESNIDHKTIYIVPPDLWGKPSIVKPQKYTISEANSYEFTGKKSVSGGILMIFGDRQYYIVSIDYNLKNPNIFPAEREIALPPSTSYQDVVIKKIKPFPISMKIDIDGNWLASYLIPPGETIKIESEFFVQTHLPEPSLLLDIEKGKFTHSDHYWESNTEALKVIQSQVSNAESIHEYVVGKLSYDYTKKSDDKKRFGARQILEDPEKAVCLEYADLFIALARGQKIPARSVEGYAYSNDATTKPLSLVKDILHAWPEYYDEKVKMWKMIDPTWSDTTGGLDYFNSFDFDHIAFVIKGASSRYPIPAGAYKLDANAHDIRVELMDQKDFNKKQQLMFTPRIKQNYLSFMPIIIDITVKNTGDTDFESGEVILESDLMKNTTKSQFPNLAPGQEETIHARIIPKNLLTKGNMTITMRFGGQISLIAINVTPYPPLEWIIIGGVFSVAAAGFIIIARKGGYLHVPGRKGNNTLRRKSEKS
jgi:hypothetical protein